MRRLDMISEQNAKLSSALQAQAKSHAADMRLLKQEVDRKIVAVNKLRDEFESKIASVIERIEATSASVSVPASAQPVTANPDGWDASQSYELVFWREHWPYRDLPLTELQTMRHGDAVWFLKQMGFAQTSEMSFDGFQGKVLEAGSGPIGFFELIDNVDVTAQDTLMDLYAEHLPYSTIGKRGSATYTGTPVPQLQERFKYVVCSNVLDHTADWIEFLRDCCALLEPGGELLLVTDSRGVPMEGHTQVFSPQQLRMVLKILGAKSFLIDRTEAVTDGHCDFRNYVRAAF
ncbi:SAM-dependent methyltransferase [Microvirga lupini]|uniref:SAM-dependent methyltransferase n=1 Tax=Microvirga lupini TaxID=420324 RepID=A0A7W4VK75_9HYPH|nr:methyltransferase domain-containing protein [Microvirga lupini]MBB3018714.1 SAM-dependent methyltransferase [Microvirga lupini]